MSDGSAAPKACPVGHVQASESSLLHGSSVGFGCFFAQSALGEHEHREAVFLGLQRRSFGGIARWRAWRERRLQVDALSVGAGVGGQMNDR